MLGVFVGSAGFADECWVLSHKQKVIALHRISENMIGVKNKSLVWIQGVDAVLDVKVLGLAIMGLSCGVINEGVSNFASSLTKGFGFSGIYATLLQLLTEPLILLLFHFVGLLRDTSEIRDV